MTIPVLTLLVLLAAFGAEVGWRLWRRRLRPRRIGEPCYFPLILPALVRSAHPGAEIAIAGFGTIM
jgi:hypothetical protein